MKNEFENSLNSKAGENSLSRQREAIKYASKLKIVDVLEIQKYLNDIENYPLLSPDQEAYLFQLYERWDERAFEKIIQSNLRFVVFVAKNFMWSWVPLADLIQEWNIWLVESAKKFDHTRWFKFISYAGYHIIQKMLLAINRSNGFSGKPAGSIRKMNIFVEKYLQENEKFPADSELKDFCRDNWIDPLFVQYYIGHTSDSEIIPLDHTSVEYKEMWIDPENLKEIYNDSIQFDNYAEMVSNWEENEVTKPLNDEDIQKVISSLLSKLTEFEKEVITMFYWIWCRPMSLDEIWIKFGVTRERARQVKERWLKRLKNLIKYRYWYMYERVINLIDIDLPRKDEDDEISNEKLLKYLV